MTSNKQPAKEEPEVGHEVQPYKRACFLGKIFARFYEFFDTISNIVLAGEFVSKQLLSQQHQREMIDPEIAIHRNLRHKHGVFLGGCFEDSENIYTLLELSFIELHKRRGATTLEARYLTLQIVNGIEYLHGKNIVHRGLKLGNIFLNDEMMVKIDHFRSATTLEKDEDRKKTLCGPPNYIAPEVLKKTCYSFEVWALACIFYTLLVGTPPFGTKSLQETDKRTKSNRYRIPSTIPNTAVKVTRELLAVVPAHGPKFGDVKKYAYFDEYTPARLPTSCLIMPPKFTKAVNMLLKRVPSPSRTLVSQQAEIEYFYREKVNENGRGEVGPENPSVPSDCYARDLYNKVKTTLLNSPTREISAIEDLAEAPECMPMIWIGKWIDCSDKYGIGYQLCDNSVGVLFNDNSQLLLDAAQQNLQYVERDDFEEYYVMNRDAERIKHLEKKIIMLKNFRNYLVKPGDKFEPKEGDELACLPCLRSWSRSRLAILFHLSNGTLQINFTDQMKLILCPHLGAVTFVDGERFRTFKLELLQKHGFDGDIRSRLRYAEGMIGRLMRNSGVRGGRNLMAPTISGESDLAQLFESLN